VDEEVCSFHSAMVKGGWGWMQHDDNLNGAVVTPPNYLKQNGAYLRLLCT